MSAANAGTQPKYNRAVVGQAVLLEIIDHHPVRLTVTELVGRIVSDRDDFGEIKQRVLLFANCKQTGLVRYRDDDELVEPTQAALHAHTLSLTL
jgi:hypothetical protein